MESYVTKLLLKIQKIIEFLLHFLRRWWRPITCVWISATIFVNGVYLPLKLNQPADMIELSALVTAVVAAFAVREWGKIKGSSE